MIDFTSLTLPRTPNTWLCAPEGLCKSARPHRLAPVYLATPQAMREALIAAMASEPRTAQAAADAATGQFAFTATSSLMRFVDDIDAKVVPLGDGRVSLALYSRSRVGYGDWGVNKKRGERILAAIAARLGA
ncbi:MAG: DUF1499 domain-containing protein [Caulobacterales bacterium]|jgi:uncharacterized protein (DUF1499 family)